MHVLEMIHGCVTLCLWLRPIACLALPVCSSADREAIGVALQREGVLCGNRSPDGEKQCKAMHDDSSGTRAIRSCAVRDDLCALGCLMEQDNVASRPRSRLQRYGLQKARISRTSYRDSASTPYVGILLHTPALTVTGQTWSNPPTLHSARHPVWPNLSPKLGNVQHTISLLPLLTSLDSRHQSSITVMWLHPPVRCKLQLLAMEQCCKGPPTSTS